MDNAIGIASFGESAPAKDLYLHFGITYVNTYVYRADSAHPCIGFDNRLATAQITEFLLGPG